MFITRVSNSCKTICIIYLDEYQKESKNGLAESLKSGINNIVIDRTKRVGEAKRYGIVV